MNWIRRTYKKTIDASKKPKKQKEFGYLLLSIIGLLLGYNSYINGFSINNNTIIFIVIIIAVTLITFKLRKVFFPILFIWLLIGEILGVIMSFVIMGIVYFLLFSPIAMLMNLVRKEKKYNPEWKTVTRKIDYTKLS